MNWLPQIASTNLQPISNRSRRWKTFSRGYTKLCVVMMMVGGVIWVTSSPHAQHFHTGPFKSGTELMTIGFIALATFWFLAGLFFLFRAISRSIDAATRPIPSPQQIAVELRAAYGRDPTWEEINAIHAILVRQRNEAAAGAAIMLGGLALGAHLAAGSHHTNGRKV